MELLIKQMAKAQGITEAFKAQDQLGWVGAVNNVRNAAAEIILSDIIFINKPGDQILGLIPLIIYSYTEL